jgi:hypothetical protein
MLHKQQATSSEARSTRFSLINQAMRFVTIDTVLIPFEFLFGCWHRSLSRPFTLSGWTYEVCLNCGKKFAYNRVEIGYEAPIGKKSDIAQTSWDDDHTRTSLLPHGARVA